jgi:exonuclease III
LPPKDSASQREAPPNNSPKSWKNAKLPEPNNPKPPTEPTGNFCSLFPLGASKLSIATWNASGLIGAPGADTKRKERTRDHLIKKHDITLIQEGHGNNLAWERLRTDLKRSHHVSFSCSASAASGGLGFFIKNDVYDQLVREPTLIEHVNGRAATLTLNFQVGNMYLSNVHVHEFNAATNNRVTSLLTQYTQLANNDPTTRSVAITAGDFNFQVNNEKPNRISLDHATTTPTVNNDNRHRSQQNAWAQFLNSNTELYQPEHTRLGHGENAKEEKYYYSSRIDRIYASWAPWQLIHLNTRTNTTCDLAKARTDCGSDHTPVSSKIAPKPRGDKNLRPIPKWIAKHPVFGTTVQEMMKHFNPDSAANPYEASQQLKQIFRKASQVAIKKIYAKDTLNNEEQFLIVLQAARCIPQNDFRVARHIKKQLPEIGQHLDLSGDTTELKNPQEFHRKTTEIASTYFKNEQK